MSNDNIEFVTISQLEYDLLMNDSRVLMALESAGVDSWEGYDEVMQELSEA